MASPLDQADLRTRVQDCIDAEHRHQRQVLAEVGPEIDDLLEGIFGLLSGGKRLRAAFLYWGYRAAGGPDSDAAVRLATSMEFFQAAALIHDDVMDDSDTRRGQPATHKALARKHTDRAWEGSADRFGAAGAILAGNLCLNWTEELFATCGLPAPALSAARPVFDRMRTQLMAGQFLDVVESVRPWHTLSTAERIERAERVIRYKSAKYTIEHPLLIGAHAAGVASTTVAALSRYGLDLGHAFQLRDDLLGVFGDPFETGKPAGDDVREGKRTVLIAQTLAAASAADAALVHDALGRPDLGSQQVESVRTVMVDSGAVGVVEARITDLAGRAHAALDQTQDLDPRALHVLHDLVDIATARSF